MLADGIVGVAVHLRVRETGSTTCPRSCRGIGRAVGKEERERASEADTETAWTSEDIHDHVPTQ